MRLGILTGGGDCPGLNAVIRGAALRAAKTYDTFLLGFEHGWKGLLESQSRALTMDAVGGILHRGGTILGTSRVDPLHDPYSLQAVRDAFAFHELDGLLVCGGDGTLSATLAVFEGGLPVIGIPKTIDNDVPGTDFSFGFDTALGHVVNAVDALHSTAEAHERVIVLEVMGRTAGWLGVCAGIAGGADVVVIPEDPMSVSEVCTFIRHRIARGRKFSIVVVSEGAEFRPDPDGTTVRGPERFDEFGRRRYGGIGEALATAIEERMQVETRTVKLGYVQRGGTPSPFDRLLGSRMGVMAVDLAASGQFGRMVSFQGGQITSVDLAVVRQGPRLVDKELTQVARVFFG
jgi:ATP-dependent phosphofructokinase / diphosphate-dependent phosphofructokinase